MLTRAWVSSKVVNKKSSLGLISFQPNLQTHDSLVRWLRTWNSLCKWGNLYNLYIANITSPGSPLKKNSRLCQSQIFQNGSPSIVKSKNKLHKRTNLEFCMVWMKELTNRKHSFSVCHACYSAETKHNYRLMLDLEKKSNVGERCCVSVFKWLCL